jgi:hypothetical protein
MNYTGKIFSYENIIFYMELENEKNSLNLRLPYGSYHGDIVRFLKQNKKWQYHFHFCFRFKKPERAQGKQHLPAVYQGSEGKRSRRRYSRGWNGKNGNLKPVADNLTDKSSRRYYTSAKRRCK